MNKKLTRDDKIKFLKGLVIGKNKITDLLPVRYIVWKYNEQDGTYFCQSLNLLISENEYKTTWRNKPPFFNIVLIRE